MIFWDLDDQLMMITVKLELNRAIFSQKFVSKLKSFFLEIQIPKKKRKSFFLESLTVYEILKNAIESENLP